MRIDPIYIPKATGFENWLERFTQERFSKFKYDRSSVNDQVRFVITDENRNPPEGITTVYIYPKKDGKEIRIEVTAPLAPMTKYQSQDNYPAMLLEALAVEWEGQSANGVQIMDPPGGISFLVKWQYRCVTFDENQKRVNDYLEAYNRARPGTTQDQIIAMLETKHGRLEKKTYERAFKKLGLALPKTKSV